MILATLANMQRYGGPDIIAVSPETGEEYSAHPGDYFALGTDDYLKDSEGHPMVLAQRIPTHYKLLEAVA